MNTPVQIFSVADLERTFGPLVSQSEASYAIRQFFANGGEEAWVVRVAGQSTAPAGPAKASVQLDQPAGTAILTATAASEGDWGNYLRLTVDFASSDPVKRFNLTVVRVDANDPPTVLATEVYRNLTLDPTDPNYAVAVVNAGSALVTLAVVGTPAATTLPIATGTVGSKDLGTVTLSSLAGQSMDVALGTTALGSVKLGTTAPANVVALASTLQGLLRGLTTAPGLSTATVTVVPPHHRPQDGRVGRAPD